MTDQEPLPGYPKMDDRTKRAGIRRAPELGSAMGRPLDARFQDRLQQAIAQAERTGEAVALHLLSVAPAGAGDRGGPDGDRWFFDTARRIGAMIRDCDASTYLGERKFAVLQRAISRYEGVMLLAHRLLDAASPVDDGGGGCATVGVSLFSSGLDAATLVTRAELASGQARAAGSPFCCFEGDDGTPPAVLLYDRLRRALARDELFLEFQPQVDLAVDRVLAVEALARWRDPRRGTVGPGAFISFAEHSGLIVELGSWILETACRRCRQWSSVAGRTVPVAVNVSAVQLEEPGFPGVLAGILERSGLGAELLELELTETVPLGETAIASLKAIAETGVRLVIDDFGTGYCSLRYLDLLPVAKLKVPAEFVQGANGSSTAMPMVTAVATIARRLGLDTVAEGVETPAQLQAVRGAGCDAAQGYLLGAPAPEPFFGAGVGAHSGLLDGVAAGSAMPENSA